tara:strand:- start:32099 stop:32866 length:768 start_codon:yes stop_codon:yes gene_type:complete
MNSKIRSKIITAILTLFLLSACSTTEPLTGIEGLEFADITAEELTNLIPDYSNDLFTLSGRGRAIVSEPGNSDRVTIRFQANRDEGLINVRNSAGIEGGQIYVDSDSLTIYNRIDKIAEKVSLQHGNLSSVGSLASVNFIELFNFTFDASEIDRIYDDDDQFVVLLTNQSLIRVIKRSGFIQNVVHANNERSAPYSRIDYDGYAEINSFQLPRRITIYSTDGNSRAALLVQQLELNIELPELGIDLPDDIILKRP